MGRGLLRIWFVISLAWLAYAIFTRWDQVFRPEPHQWEAALNVGINMHIYCEFPSRFECMPSSWIPSGNNFLLEQDFQLIVTFALYPLALAVFLAVLGWVFAGFWKKQ